jgi:NAD(P)H-dependent FMN reductase
VEEAIAAVESADAVAIGSPIYRASFAHPLKVFFDQFPRGMWGETRAPLRGRAVARVATGATLHHFLGLNDLRNVLAELFAGTWCHPVSTSPATASTTRAHSRRRTPIRRGVRARRWRSWPGRWRTRRRSGR